MCNLIVSGHARSLPFHKTYYRGANLKGVNIRQKNYFNV